jgi:phosphoribosylaminoimidazole-succinocarboxamide synthase
MIAADGDEIIDRVPGMRGHRQAVAGRAMLCRRGTVFPIECVIRGYLSGSAWREYARQERSPARRCRPACRKAAGSIRRSSARRPSRERP